MLCWLFVVFLSSLLFVLAKNRSEVHAREGEPISALSTARVLIGFFLYISDIQPFHSFRFILLFLPAASPAKSLKTTI